MAKTTTITKYLMLVMLVLAIATGGSEGRFHFKPLTKAQDIASAFVGTQFDVHKVPVGAHFGKFRGNLKGKFMDRFGPMLRP